MSNQNKTKMSEINKVYRVAYMRDRFSYIGTLRNEKKFNIKDEVFFSISGGDISIGTIVGIEYLPDEDSDYIYKIKIPEELVRERMKSEHFYEGKDFENVKINCERVFSTVQEAKESALANLERMSRLQMESIENYFKQFE